MLRLDALFAAAKLGAGAPVFKGIQDIFHVSLPARFDRVLTRPFPGRKPALHGVWGHRFEGWMGYNDQAIRGGTGHE
jgi:hypothetical protein